MFSLKKEQFYQIQVVSHYITTILRNDFFIDYEILPKIFAKVHFSSGEQSDVANPIL